MKQIRVELAKFDNSYVIYLWKLIQFQLHLIQANTSTNAIQGCQRTIILGKSFSALWMFDPLESNYLSDCLYNDCLITFMILS